MFLRESTKKGILRSSSVFPNRGAAAHKAKGALKKC